MRNLLLTISLMAIAFGASASKIEGNNKTEAILEETKIEVYYFHFSRRCATCNAVEEVSQKALQEFFASELENETIKFVSVNLDEDSGKEIGEKLEVAAQKLLIVSGEEKIDLTNLAFLNARTNPDKLKNKIKEEIENIL